MKNVMYLAPDGIINMLGTGFIISNDGKIATTKHVVGSNPSNLVVLAPHINNINEYQDTSDLSCQCFSTIVLEMDPIKDLCVLKSEITFSGILPKVGSFDEVNVGEKVGIYSYPHCVEGRRVLTFQETEIGAKVLLDSNSIKTKHAIINTQARPGQSGGIVFSYRLNKIVGVLVGAYAPSLGGGISLGGINPRELHQTTHCISAEYINDMIENIESIKLEDWLSELKKYQRDSMLILIQKFGEEEAIYMWLSSQGPKDNVPFGGDQNQDIKPFIDRFKDECKKFICNHPDYEDDWRRLKLESPVLNSVLISVVSAAIGAKIGMTATLLAPVIAVMLSVVGKMGIRAYCIS